MQPELQSPFLVDLLSLATSCRAGVTVGDIICRIWARVRYYATRVAGSMAHRPSVTGMVRLDALVVWSMGVLMRRIGWVVVEHGNPTRRSGRPAIETGGRPRLVARIVHALGGTSLGIVVGRLGRRTRTWRNVTEKSVQERLVRERVLR